MTIIDANELKVGDTIEVWWAPGRDTVIAIDPYNGPLKDIISCIARFALLKSGMSIGHTDQFNRIN